MNALKLVMIMLAFLAGFISHIIILEKLKIEKEREMKTTKLDEDFSITFKLPFFSL